MVFVHVYTFLIINKTIRNVATNGWWLLRASANGWSTQNGKPIAHTMIFLKWKVRQ